MLKVMPKEIRSIIERPNASMSDNDHDEMAIPSYLHSNPMIRWLMWERYRQIEAFLTKRTADSVFEFGCGLGLFLPTLAVNVKTVYANDLFPHYAKELCRRKGLNVQFVDHLDQIEENSLDAIVAADVLEHVDDPSEFARKFHRFLKKDGRLLVSGPTETPLYKLGRLVAGFGDKAHYHHTTIIDLARVIGEAGFVSEASAQLPFPIGPSLFRVISFVKTH